MIASIEINVLSFLFYISDWYKNNFITTYSMSSHLSYFVVHKTSGIIAVQIDVLILYFPSGDIRLTEQNVLNYSSLIA